MVGPSRVTSHDGRPVLPVRLIRGALALSRVNRDADARPTAGVSPKADWFSAYVLPPANLPAMHAGTGAGPEADAALYAHVAEAPFVTPADQPTSIVPVEAGWASFLNVRRLLNHNAVPPAEAVRAEELLNYFSWRAPAPQTGDAFSGDIEVGICPWNVEHRLARVVLKARELSPQTRPPVNIVFLVDVSRSMAGEDKLPLAKKGMRLLLSQIGKRDRLSIVAAPQSDGFLLAPTPGDDHIQILDGIERLKAGGSFAAGSGVETAYYAARSSYIPGGINRVVLITDGNWLAGASSPANLSQIIEAGAKSGISLGVVAIAPKHLADEAMRHLAAAGGGTLSAVDTIGDAQRELFGQVNGSLVQAAHDVRIQVSFNPAIVASHRLVGYDAYNATPGDSLDDASASEIGAVAPSPLFTNSPRPRA